MKYLFMAHHLSIQVCVKKRYIFGTKYTANILQGPSSQP